MNEHREIKIDNVNWEIEKWFTLKWKLNHFKSNLKPGKSRDEIWLLDNIYNKDFKVVLIARSNKNTYYTELYFSLEMLVGWFFTVIKNELAQYFQFFRSIHSELFLRNCVLKICSRFTGEHSCRSVISIKLLCNSIEIALRHGCFSVNLLHIFRTPFPKNTSGWLLLFLELFHSKIPINQNIPNSVFWKSIVIR